MSWREKAQRVLAERDNWDGRVESPPNGSIVPYVSVAEATATARLHEWAEALSRIDQFCTPPGWTLNDWLKLTDTGFWLAENHAAYAVRHGWSAHDLFGVRLGYPCRGGLADLLDGARNLKLSGGKAYWSHFGVPFSIGLGIGKGCALLWEIAR